MQRNWWGIAGLFLEPQMQFDKLQCVMIKVELAIEVLCTASAKLWNPYHSPIFELQSKNFNLQYLQNEIERFLISVDSFMSLQIAGLLEFLVTLWAAEWLRISMDSFMDLQSV